MTSAQKIKQIIDISWTSYKNKVAAGLLKPDNEKMMQLQYAQTLQTLTSLYEFTRKESIKILLEEPVNIARQPSKRIIDIVIQHVENDCTTCFPIELKCFRKRTRDGKGNRGAQNIGMYDYWVDIENIEQYGILPNYSFGTQLTLTDDSYYMNGRHAGQQTSTYSTNNSRSKVTGLIEQTIANRHGRIELIGEYDTTTWETIGDFHFIRQESNHLLAKSYNSHKNSA